MWMTEAGMRMGVDSKVKEWMRGCVRGSGERGGSGDVRKLDAYGGIR